MANVASQTEAGLRVDLRAFTRGLDRARRNTVRPRERNEEVKRLLSRLVVIFTEETAECSRSAAQ